jgi:hypothetical protein
MKKIYSIILFVLAFSIVQAHENPVEGFTEVALQGLTLNKNYKSKVTALYTASKVEKSSESTNETSETLVSYTGWFKDWHCAPTSSSTTLTGSCSVACGTGGLAGTSMVNGCQAHGHGIWINPTSATSDDGKFLHFDAESAELLKAFLFQLHDSLSATVKPNGKLSLEVTGYPVQVPANADESTVPYLDGDPDHYIEGFHTISVKGVIIGDNSYYAFATKDFKLTLDALAPKNVVASKTIDGYNVTFDKPLTASSLSPKFGVKGYRVDTYENDVLIKSETVTNNPTSPLTQIPLTGLTTIDGYTFHVYAKNGVFNNAYNEIYISLTDNNGEEVCSDDYLVSNFSPLMDMGMMVHSTPVGKVDKVDGTDFYKTWFSFLMPGDWTFGFDYNIKGTTGQFAKTAIPFSVNSYPTGATHKWLTNFQYDDDGDGTKSYFYVSLVSPQSLVVGSQTIKAYINKRVALADPYPVANKVFKIVQIPVMRSMGHSSHGNTDFVWNAVDSVYSATTNFSMEGDWRINLAIYDAVADTLIAGTNIGTDYETSSSVNWDIYLDLNAGTVAQTNENSVTVYPTISNGEFNIITLEKGFIKLLDSTGKILKSYNSTIGINTINANVPSGLYFITVDEAGKQSTYKVIVRK